MDYTPTPAAPTSLCVTVDDPALQQKGESLADRLNLNFAGQTDCCTTDLVLFYTREGLKLGHFVKDKLKPLVFIDFITGKKGFRHVKNYTISQPLARAVGVKPGYRPRILDATAGLGADGFALAVLGCSVTLFERNPVLYELLKDGLERAGKQPESAAIIAEKVQLIQTDIITSHESLNGLFDTVYLDPMYPHRNSSALNKQVMRILRLLVGDDEDSHRLFYAARTLAPARIAVKRPKGAPCIADLRPDHQVKMKSGRFDIYFKK
ncbi:class I SAM-dependent methyltransferase [Desulforhopalus singaporensis]|uniref:Ribosomal RNA small subunit methyltransferase J n=1 Tax=Desulforhopalus singaporensis TaxID=91360 RepID=A0A1H0PDU4_9BACT|nr:class I SAM-dependent methyltransferase [Desulforhopalus singaporensis]SDP03262.1 16S rRNA (guanine1516-N2)-methyltransferase [Desulforhopalus singaporensis]